MKFINFNKYFIFSFLIGLLFLKFACDPEKSEEKDSKNKIKISGTFTINGKNNLKVGESQVYTVEVSKIEPQEILKGKFSLTIQNAPKGVTISDLNLEKKTFKIKTTAETPATAEKEYTFILTVDSEDEKYSGFVEAKLTLTFVKDSPTNPVNPPDKPRISGSFSITGDGYIIKGSEVNYTLDDTLLKPTGLFSSLKSANKSLKLAFKSTPLTGMTIGAFNLDTKKFKITTTDSTPITASATYNFLATVDGYQGSAEGNIAIEIASETTITSTAVNNGETIAAKYGGLGTDAENRYYFPPLSFSGKPANGTVSRFLVLQDNNSKRWDHGIWIINLNTTSIPEIKGTESRYSLSGKTGIKEEVQQYYPPQGGGHLYKFHLFDISITETELKQELARITSSSHQSRTIDLNNDGDTEDANEKITDRVATIKRLLGDKVLNEVTFSYYYQLKLF